MSHIEKANYYAFLAICKNVILLAFDFSVIHRLKVIWNPAYYVLT